MSALRAAKDYKQRPTSMILHDPYALHRKWWDREWKPEFGDDSWTDWDYILADVYQTIDDYTDKSTGQYMPFDQSGDVWWDVKSKFSGSEAAIDKAKESRGDLKPGESLYAVPVFDETKPKPTLESWAKELDEGKADLRPAQHVAARPPTPEELAELRSSQG